VGGRPLIHYAIALLKKYGVTDIAINLHHLGELIERELGDGRDLGVRITYSMEEEILGTGGGLKKMAPFFEGEDFWVLNSDVLIDADLAAIASEHRKHQAKATMLLRPHPIQDGSAERPTALFRDETGRIVSFASGEAIAARRQENPLMFTGIHLMHPSLLEYLPAGFSCIFQDAYRPAIEAGDRIYGALYEGYWRDLGTMESYRATDQELAEGRVSLSYLRPPA
jgi:NDP-sugar pyrophosphorylase family protein